MSFHYLPLNKFIVQGIVVSDIKFFPWGIDQENCIFSLRFFDRWITHEDGQREMQTCTLPVKVLRQRVVLFVKENVQEGCSLLIAESKIGYMDKVSSGGDKEIGLILEPYRGDIILLKQSRKDE